jgi:C4-dicarboxylate transporter
LRLRSPSAPPELDVMRRLRRVLKRSSAGLGLAASFVSVFSSSRDRTECEAVRRILLGTPVEEALDGLVSVSASSGELVRFIAALARFNSLEASKGAQKLSAMFDRWTLLRERRSMEMKVMRFRGLIVSAVAGVVVGMLSTLGPVISSFHISLSAAATIPATPGVFLTPYEGGLFLLPSSICLGVYLSPERPYVNAIISLLAFAGVVYFLGPLTTFSLGP